MPINCSNFRCEDLLCEDWKCAPINCKELSLEWRCDLDYGNDETCKIKSKCNVEEKIYTQDGAKFIYDARYHHYIICLPFLPDTTEPRNRFSIFANLVTISHSLEIGGCIWAKDLFYSADKIPLKAKIEELERRIENLGG